MSVEAEAVEPEAHNTPADAAGVASEMSALGARAGELIELLGDAADPEVRAQVDELLRAIDVLHREGLLRLTAVLARHHLLEEACADPVIDLVLDLYELTPALLQAAAAPPPGGGSGFVKVSGLRPLPVRQSP